METSATISECGKYRYTLTRRWDHELALLPFIMLNPSTADASVDDPTIRRCIGFAKREKYGGIIVGNLYAFRATKPADMRAALDPIGPDNDLHLSQIGEMAGPIQGPVICAWGAVQDAGRWRRVSSLLRGEGGRLFCLGRTSAGHPRHPLYTPADEPLDPWP